MRSALLIVMLSLLLSSCATTGLYNWGHYEDDLFEYYNEPTNKAEIAADLVEHLEEQEAKGATPAPGLFAEAGTYYLLEGDAATAIQLYEKEAQYWPESKPMMSVLIHNLEGN